MSPVLLPVYKVIMSYAISLETDLIESDIMLAYDIGMSCMFRNTHLLKRGLD